MGINHMEKKYKIVDGFLWFVFRADQARLLFNAFELYRLYEDGTEALIEGLDEIIDDQVYGVEVGFLNEIIS